MSVRAVEAAGVPSTWLRIGQVAAAAEVNLETLRYYERRGLLSEVVRSPGGHRLYPPETVTRLRVVRAAQRLGFSLAEVAELLDVGRHRHGVRGAPEQAGLQQRVRGKLAEVEARIGDLRTIRETLVAALDTGCHDLEQCADDERCPIPFAALSSGPRIEASPGPPDGVSPESRTGVSSWPRTARRSTR